MGKIEDKQVKTKRNRIITIKTALPEQAEKLLVYTKQILFESAYLLTTPQEFTMTLDRQKQWLSQMLNNPNKLVIIAEYNNEIIGLLDFHNGNKKRIEHQGMFGMSVRKEFQQEGIGRALLNTLIEWVKTNPAIEKIGLEVLSKNTNAIQLYRKLGFIEEGRKRRAIKLNDNTYDDIILMGYFVE